MKKLHVHLRRARMIRNGFTAHSPAGDMLATVSPVYLHHADFGKGKYRVDWCAGPHQGETQYAENLHQLQAMAAPADPWELAAAG